MRAKYYLAAGLGLMLVIALVACPSQTFSASLTGLNLWWKAVIPALLPFLIAVELLSGLGAINFLGVFLDPLMRGLFRVPGIGGFILAASLASGFPTGVMLTSQYRQTLALSREDGERLAAFAHNAGPLFITGSVAIGMLGLPQAAPLLALAQYSSCLGVGLIMRFYKPGAAPLPLPRSKTSIMGQALKALISARKQDGRSYIRLFNDAVQKGIKTILLLGGYIVSFSVLNELVLATGVISLFARLFSINNETLQLFCAGALEVTTGCNSIAQSSLSVAGKIIAVSAAIGWSGLSVQGQAAAFASATDLSLRPFLFARVLHACLAALTSALLLAWRWPALSLPVVSSPVLNAGWVALCIQSIQNLGLMLGVLLGLGLVVALIAKIPSKVALFRAP